MRRRRFMKSIAAAAASYPVAAGSTFADTIPVKRIHVVFKTHLDVGYTDLARNVLERYFLQFIPQAMGLARRLREEDSEARMVWTTGAWLIDAFLEQGMPMSRRLMEEAIACGDVAWHALPMTFHSELVEASHFRAGLQISKRLDARFGKKTIAAKMTDVPGHTRAIVPLLHEAGIEFLHIGVNPASSAPETPALFRWRDEATDTEIAVAYSKGSYGDLVSLEGMDDALFIAMTNDNHGPQTADAIAKLHRQLRSDHPGAETAPGRMDDFAVALRAHRERLPVITQELGDTWIHGVGADPQMTIPYRELCRLRRNWLARGVDEAHAQALERFSRRLLFVPEHTWGLSEMASLGDYEHYGKSEFHRRRGRENYRRIERAWADKRSHVAVALKKLDGTPLAEEADQKLRALRPKKPDVTRYKASPQTQECFDTPHFRLHFAPTGAIDFLETKEKARIWAGPENQLGSFRYEVFSLAEFQRFHDRYTIIDANWGRSDLGKVCLEPAPTHYQEAIDHYQTWTAVLQGLRQREDDTGIAFLAESRLPKEASERFGAPRLLFSEFFFPHDRPQMSMKFQFFDKDASRIGEGLWLSFAPCIQDPQGWTLFKMGQPFSPHDVIQGGNQHLHAVDPGVAYQDGQGGLRIDSPDAALCAPGSPALLEFDDVQPDLRGGVHFNLYNNIWGTNFRSWYDEDTSFRFDLTFL